MVINMDTNTNDALLKLVDVVMELASQVGNLPIKGVDVQHVYSQLLKVRRELICTELSD